MHDFHFLAPKTSVFTCNSEALSFLFKFETVVLNLQTDSESRSSKFKTEIQQWICVYQLPKSRYSYKFQTVCTFNFPSIFSLDLVFLFPQGGRLPTGVGSHHVTGEPT